jgi:ubiquinone/menaquinone biosynthesis C-methylase UbiE
MQNFFSYQTAAERYARARPYFHPLVMDKISEYLGLQKPLPQALDVGCGTGQSTRALTAIAERVVGSDLSAEMLAQAPVDARIQYLQAPAETLPLPDATFDILTVSLAFHWFDRARFLNEARRLLRPAAWLVIYNNGFSGEMKENPLFAQWNQERYLRRFPTPARHNQPLEIDEARQYGFLFAHGEAYSNLIRFTVEQLAVYLTTQSNVIAAVEQGGQTYESTFAWLVDELTPLFPTESATFSFGGSIWYLQKI